jgi:DNA polymerase III subunit gamma/tau
MAENFVVSARKYRPITFDTVVGQSHITTTLRNAIRTRHLAQAFLFCGPRGVGKTTTARILAKTINCQNLSEDVEPCGQCEACVTFQNNASFNIHELDAASNNSVEDIRNLIDQVRYPPQTGKYKIYIIDEVHMLSTAAFNAFLKTLEEPPSYAIFILATTEKHKILPTILSRCQIFDFNRIQVRDMADHLARIAQKEGISAEPEALELIAQKADGGLRDALSMFDLNVTFSTTNALTYSEVIENLHVLDYDYYFKLTDYLVTANLPHAILTFNEIIKKGFDGHLFLVGLLEHFRNLLVCQDAVTVQLLEVTESTRNKYLEQSSKASAHFLLSALSIGSQCDVNYKTSKNQRLHVEICLMKLAKLNSILNLDSLAAEPIESKKKVVSEPSHQTATVSTPPVATTIAKPISKLRDTVSLSAPPPVVVTTPEVKLSQAAEQATPYAQDRAFGFADLQKAWQALIAERKSKQIPVIEEIILNRDIKLNGTTIWVPLDNPVQESHMAELKGEWLIFLRQYLSNRTIQISTEIIVQDVKRNPYSPQEKFRALAEKNPALLHLQQALGLEVDY